MKKNVLGVKIDDVNMEEALAIVKGWLGGKGQHFIVTPNPEMVMLANQDQQFKQILNSADLAIPDGVGLKLKGIKNRVTGVDLMEALMQFDNVKIGLLGSKPGVAEKAAECLLKKYPGLQFSFISDGGNLNNNELVGKVESVEYRVSSSKNNKKTSLYTLYSIPDTDFLFVAFGHGKQEKWIVENLKDLPVKVAMGVGGAFDYFSGNVPRAPKWVRNIGLEWLYRLIAQPWRIKRQLALIKFIFS